MMSARNTVPESPSCQHFPNQWNIIAAPPRQPWDTTRQWNTATQSPTQPRIPQSAVMLTPKPFAATMSDSVSTLWPESITPSVQHGAIMALQSSDHGLNTTLHQHNDSMDYSPMSQTSPQWMSHVDWEALNRFYADQVVPETPHTCHSNGEASYNLPLRQNCNRHDDSLTESLFTRVRFHNSNTMGMLFHESNKCTNYHYITDTLDRFYR